MKPGDSRGLEDAGSALRVLWLVTLDVDPPLDWANSTWWAAGLALSRCLINASRVFPTLRPGSGEIVYCGLRSLLKATSCHVSLTKTLQRQGLLSYSRRGLSTGHSPRGHSVSDQGGSACLTPPSRLSAAFCDHRSDEGKKVGEQKYAFEDYFLFSSGRVREEKLLSDSKSKTPVRIGFFLGP